MVFFAKLFLFLHLFTLLLFANIQLQQEYLVTAKTVKISDIIKSPKKDSILFNINANRHSKRVKASYLIKELKSYGYHDITSRHAYIQFTQKSPLNTKKLTSLLKRYYKEHYKNIEIQKITIKPIKYLSTFPKNFTVGFRDKAYLSHKGTFYIKTVENKKIFFNYTLLAKLSVYRAKKKIEKSEPITRINTEKKSIILDKFRAFPLMDISTVHYEAKHRIRQYSLITQRDVITLHLVKRGENVTVTLKNQGIYITFLAKALQSGRLGETIRVMHKNKKIRVRVTGKNRAEVE